jgi:hypothetical protein
MTLNTILHGSSGTLPATFGAKGIWYIATDLLSRKSLEEILQENNSGAVLLAFRRGFWSGDRSREDLELFLWGTEQQHAEAQELLKLQTLEDALLNSPEPYWG